MPALTVTKVTLDGDFFRNDPKKTIRRNIRDMLEDLGEWMEDTTRADIASHAGSMPFYSGWSWAHTEGYTRSPKTGKRWELHAAVAAVSTGMNRDDAIRTKAAAASIERRWHPYRRVKSAIYRARPLISANLTEGLE